MVLRDNSLIAEISEHKVRDVTVQHLQLELLRRSNCKDMNGEEIVNALITNPTLWYAVSSDSYSGRFMAWKLGDIANNIWDINAVWILSSGIDDDALLRLIAEWNPFKVSPRDTLEFSSEVSDRKSGQVYVAMWRTYH